MKKLILSCLALVAISAVAACLDVSPYPILETEAGVPDTPDDAGADE